MDHGFDHLIQHVGRQAHHGIERSFKLFNAYQPNKILRPIAPRLIKRLMNIYIVLNFFIAQILKGNLRAITLSEYFIAY